MCDPCDRVILTPTGATTHALRANTLSKGLSILQQFLRVGYDLPNIANQVAIGQDQTSQTCVAPKELLLPCLPCPK